MSDRGPLHAWKQAEDFNPKWTVAMARQREKAKRPAGNVVGLKSVYQHRIETLESKLAARESELEYTKKRLETISDKLTRHMIESKAELSKVYGICDAHGIKIKKTFPCNQKDAHVREWRKHVARQEIKRHPTAAEIVKLTARYFSVEVSDLKSRRRFRDLVIPRNVASFLARQHTLLSFPQIGKHIGGRDHSTVMHSVRWVEQRLDHDHDVSRAVYELSGVLSKWGG